jgi:hypothetical protein
MSMPELAYPRKCSCYESETFDSNLIALSTGGIQVQLPHLLAGDRVQIQLTVAWSAHIQDNHVTRFAIDRRPSEILAGARCD